MGEAENKATAGGEGQAESKKRARDDEGAHEGDGVAKKSKTDDA